MLVGGMISLLPDDYNRPSWMLSERDEALSHSTKDIKNGMAFQASIISVPKNIPIDFQIENKRIEPTSITVIYGNTQASRVYYLVSRPVSILVSFYNRNIRGQRKVRLRLELHDYLTNKKKL